MTSKNISNPMGDQKVSGVNDNKDSNNEHSKNSTTGRKSGRKKYVSTKQYMADNNIELWNESDGNAPDEYIQFTRAMFELYEHTWANIWKFPKHTRDNGGISTMLAIRADNIMHMAEQFRDFDFRFQRHELTIRMHIELKMVLNYLEVAHLQHYIDDKVWGSWVRSTRRALRLNHMLRRMSEQQTKDSK